MSDEDKWFLPPTIACGGQGGTCNALQGGREAGRPFDHGDLDRM